MAVKDKLKSYFKIYESDETRQVFENNESEANRLTSMVLIFSAVILVASFILDFVGIFKVKRETMIALTIQGVFELAIPLTLYYIFRKKHCRWLKYVMVIGLLLVMMRLFSVLNHNVILVMVLPVIISARYCSKGFTMLISALGVIALAGASISTVFFGIADLNIYPSPPEGTVLIMKETLRATVLDYGADMSKIISKTIFDGFLPRLLVYLLICLISVLIAKHGCNMVLEQNRIAKVAAAVSVELETATQIQNSMVPNIFPAFPERKEFDVFASMDTAKEVGGDFYDFFLIDKDHLGMVIADVSGKGIPAALFMMATKILITDRTLMGGTPAEILEFVNNRVCARNEAEMFVTVWLGILDITTGKLIASNAGHEYPVIYRNGQRCELYKDRHGFVIGGMEGMKYKNYEITLGKDDMIFLYTDGVPEATDANGTLFSTDRMLEALDARILEKPKEIIGNVKAEIDNFVKDAPQFDDITMLCLRYHGCDSDNPSDNGKEET